MKILKSLMRWVERHLIYDEIQDVRDFNEKFKLPMYDTPGHLTSRKLQERICFIEEELKEFKEAVAIQDLAGQADALIDLAYVVKGTAIMLGLPWEDLWLDVQRANMGKELRSSNGDNDYKLGVFKPPGWKGPSTDDVLKLHGYNRDKWTRKNLDTVDEGKCRA